ncbi:AAA family ATPase [bacterium]|nr:AAA family ATPase [bacterium]
MIHSITSRGNKISVKPLTVFVGPNSGGKSTILNSLLNIKSSWPDFSKMEGDIEIFVPRFEDVNSYIDNDDIRRKLVKNRDKLADKLRNMIELRRNVSLDGDLSKKELDEERDSELKNLITANDNVIAREHEIIRNLKSNTFIENGILNLPSAMVSYSNNTITIQHDNKMIYLDIHEENRYSLNLEFNELNRANEIFRELDVDNIIKAMDELKEYINNIHMINPVRLDPNGIHYFKFYDGSIFDLLIKHYYDSYPNIHPDDIEELKKNKKGFESHELKIDTALEYLCIAEGLDFHLEEIESHVLQEKLSAEAIMKLSLVPEKDYRGYGKSTHLSDLGFGISQVIPVIIEAICREDYSTLLFQEPEAHLHPNLQCKLGSLFARFTRENLKTYILETHSEHIVRGIQLAVSQKELDRKHIAIYYVDKDRSPQVEEMKLTEDGLLENDWPNDFYSLPYNIGREIRKNISKN